MAKITKIKGKNENMLRIRNQKRLRQINNIVVEASLVKKGLAAFQEQLAFENNPKQKSTSLQIIVPSTRATKTTTIRRTPEKVAEIVKERIETKENLQSIVFAISLTEDYINEVVVNVLKAHPKKLLLSAKGNSQTGGQGKTVTLESLIDANSVDEILQEQARMRARDALYAAPASYLKYLNDVLGFEISEELFEKFSEVKATRDLYVHGDGTINSIYLAKAGALARGAEGDLAPLGNTYFEEAIGTMKQVFSQIFKGMRDKYGDCEQLNSVMLVAS